MFWGNGGQAKLSELATVATATEDTARAPGRGAWLFSSLASAQGTV